MKFSPSIFPVCVRLGGMGLIFGFGLPGFPASAEVDFARDIRPILNANCIECHGGLKASGNVSYVYEDRVVDFEGKSGYTVVKPGIPEESELYFRITTDDEDDRMPPPDEHDSLSEKEIALIEQWIEEGAKWGRHWAFEAPGKPRVPKTAFDKLANGNLDRILFSRLEKEGLEPSPKEEPGRLLRRLSLSLTGLPPSLPELNAFERAYSRNAQRAFKRAVDDLMDRPAFGERWATMWLDLVRYADSGGLGQDQPRTIWAYRDWVVEAFNRDMPFDQFTIKQLAGDLLPNPTIEDLVATACQRNTQTNVEGGTDDEEFRVEAVVDRINTTWQTWGSVTFGCAQCHDHPYDPFRNDEYYKFMAFYNNSADSDLINDVPLLKVPDESNRYKEAGALRKRILDLKKAIWKSGTALRDKVEWTGLRQLEVSSNNSTEYAVVEKQTHDEFHTVGTVETQTHTRIDVPGSSFGGEEIRALQLTVLPWDPETAIHSPEWGFVVDDLEAWVTSESGSETPVSFRWSVPDVPWMPTDPMQSIGPNGQHWGADTLIHYARQLALVPEQPIRVKEGETLSLYIHCNKRGAGGSHPMVIQRGHLASSSDERWEQLGDQLSKDYRRSQKLTEAITRYSEIPGTTVPIMHRRPNELARPTHLLIRGNSREKGAEVFAGLPETLTEVAPVEGSIDRLAMARWWVSDDHPLTSRAFVNRLWEQLFGVGIVFTLEDFGSSGEKPTHPELLDYLAVRFQKDYDWSVKAILREIVLSYAFQQASPVTPELLERDPDNRLIARGPRLRLTAEMVRDQALAVSGLLSSKVGGPSVYPPLPEGVWQPFQKKNEWTTPEPGNPDRYRRSIYTHVKRSIPFPAFATFDAPSREFCTPRRLTSNTPLQALVTLNDQTFVECAEAMAKQLERDYPEAPEAALAQAHRLVTGRSAHSDRLETLTQLYRQVNMESPENAWRVVAQVLLNLDDTLTF
ncbi:MAG: DUF1553 domain-containing protein [Opitutae bacterium]|nr:DUF1553 domain-containing protein [Opitutae bacterium]